MPYGLEGDVWLATTLMRYWSKKQCCSFIHPFAWQVRRGASKRSVCPGKAVKSRSALFQQGVSDEELPFGNCSVDIACVCSDVDVSP